MVLIQCHGKSRAIQCRYIISIHDYLSFVCEHALICTCGTFFYIFPDTAVDELSTDYDIIDGRIAGNRRSYPDIFQRSINSPRMHELCQTHIVVET